MKSFIEKIYSVLVLSFCLSVIFCGGLLFQNINSVLTTSAGDWEITVYPTSTEVDLDHLKKKILELGQVEEVKIITPEQTVSEFKEQMASLGSLNFQINDIISAVPSSLTVLLLSSAERSQAEAMKIKAQEIMKIPGVESVDYGQKWIDQFSEISSVLKLMVYSIGLFVFLIVGFVSYSSIQVSLLQKKEEIQILELIGASHEFIRRPYLRQALIHVLISVSVASCFVYILFEFLKQTLAKNNLLAHLSRQIHFLDWKLWVAGSVVYILLVMISSGVSIRKINNGWAAAKNS